MTNFPINLGNIIIHPTVVHPHQHISIQVIIILQTTCVAAIRVTLYITINSERRDTEFHPRLALAHRLMDFLYQHIHVVTAPIGFITVSATILCKTDIVGKILSRIRIRIKIIIHVNGIHIITSYNVAHNLTDVFPILGQRRIKIKLSGIIHETFGILVIRMNGRQGGRSFRLGTVRINPGMELHSPLVAFINHELHRVPIG